MRLSTRYIYPFFLSSLLVGQGMLFSQVSNWTGNAGDNDWSTPGNWDNGVPNSVDAQANFEAHEYLLSDGIECLTSV